MTFNSCDLLGLLSLNRNRLSEDKVLIDFAMSLRIKERRPAVAWITVVGGSRLFAEPVDIMC